MEDLLTKSPRKTCVTVIVFVYILYQLTLISTSITQYNANALDFIFHLPWSYWIGMLLLLFLLYLFDIKNDYNFKYIQIYHITTIILFILYLYGVVTFAYIYPRSLDSFMVVSWLESLEIYGISDLPTPIYLSAFPGSLIFFLLISLVTGLKHMVLAKFASLFFMFLLSIISYITYHSITREYKLFPAVIFIPFTWVQEYHLLPQTYALILTSIMIYLLLHLFTSYHNKKIIFLLFIIIIAITVSHPLTSILNIIALAIIFIAIVFITIIINKFFSETNDNDNAAELKIIFTMSFYFLLFLIIQLIYLSTFMTEKILDTMLTNINALLDFQNMHSKLAISDRFVDNPHLTYLIGFYLRWFVIIGVSIIGLLSSFFITIKNYNKMTYILFATLFLGYTSFSLLLGIAGYGVYGMDRGYMFSLLPFTIIASLVFFKFNRKSPLKLLIISLFIIALIIFPITKYSSDPYNFISESEMSMINFNDKSPIKYCSVSDSEYNFIELKNQGGKEYLNMTIIHNKIYISGRNFIFQLPK
ncbi:MAG: hypothetical protein XE11_1816 [Methanomicrobiales archaeon 53_19]|uniref:hypothetical protein n=1 Tax=Methanocalculus sp. TaxID=2004547 RepID=UPI000749E6DC|nr:hypothetical protein [Methanocalculus sp.]KUL02319.1 MAG: hypothetical protein XE11_1816 [Methanomicrobiales archaeon 53_19]HIJ05877.1 hypothetical protein [Methanocalculus sp.]